MFHDAVILISYQTGLNRQIIEYWWRLQRSNAENRFFDVKFDNKTATVLLENPSGVDLFASVAELQQQMNAVLATSKQLSTTSGSLKPVSSTASPKSLHAQTLYLL